MVLMISFTVVGCMSISNRQSLSISVWSEPGWLSVTTVSMPTSQKLRQLIKYTVTVDSLVCAMLLER